MHVGHSIGKREFYLVHFPKLLSNYFEINANSKKKAFGFLQHFLPSGKYDGLELINCETYQPFLFYFLWRR
jgi:hypothetical protein